MFWFFLVLIVVFQLWSWFCAACSFIYELNLWREKLVKTRAKSCWALDLSGFDLEKTLLLFFKLMLWFFVFWWQFCISGAGFALFSALFISWICEERNQEKPAQSLAGRLIWAILILRKNLLFCSNLLFPFLGFDGYFPALARVFGVFVWLFSD